jgi:hypothetical protein
MSKIFCFTKLCLNAKFQELSLKQNINLNFKSTPLNLFLQNISYHNLCVFEVYICPSSLTGLSSSALRAAYAERGFDLDFSQNTL